jgi:hypothetical protein
MANNNNSFVKAFLPGLVIGLIVGGIAGAVLPELFTPSKVSTHKTGAGGSAVDRDAGDPGLRDREFEGEPMPELNLPEGEIPGQVPTSPDEDGNSDGG